MWVGELPVPDDQVYCFQGTEWTSLRLCSPPGSRRPGGAQAPAQVGRAWNLCDIIVALVLEGSGHKSGLHHEWCWLGDPTSFTSVSSSVKWA